jgi:hypothetical protein
VTVAHAEGAPVSKRLCITAVEAPPEREGRLVVNIEAPPTAEQGQTVLFKITVKNDGQTALVNITTREEYQPAVLQPMPADRSVEVVSGTITRHIPRLDIGQSRQFEVQCLCRQSTRVVSVVRASAQTDPPTRTLETAAEHELVIAPAGHQPGAGTGQAPPGAAVSPLAVRVSFGNPQARVNARATTEILVKNNSTIAQRDVNLRVAFPPEVTPDVTSAEGPQNATVQLKEGFVVFSPLATLAPGETVLYRIPMNPTQVGIVPVTAQVISRTVTQPVEHTENLEILGNRL